MPMMAMTTSSSIRVNPRRATDMEAPSLYEARMKCAGDYTPPPRGPPPATSAGPRQPGAAGLQSNMRAKGDLMANVWFTADLHLGHGNIIRYCLRPFLSPEERERARRDRQGKWRLSEETVRHHDEALLSALNAAVGAKDVLWLLGDFCWGGLEAARAYRDRIACENVHLVWGNHDHRSIRPLFDQAIEQGMVNVDGQE